MKQYKTWLISIKNRIIHGIKSIGPGFITGSADDDPSGIGTYSIAGAKYGLSLAWLFPFQLPFMFCIQEMCARIGIVTRNGLTQNMKLIFPKPLIYGAIAILTLANTINIGANISIMAHSIQLLIDHPIHLLALYITLIIVVVTVSFSYHIYAKILLILTCTLLSYVITAFLVTSDWLHIIQSVITPHLRLEKDFILVAAGCIGTTISPYLFFWQTSQEVEDMQDRELHTNYKKTEIEKLKDSRADTFLGMLFSQIIGLFILITCYETLHLNGITQITSAADAATALKPFAGENTYLIFTLGIIGTGFLGIPVLAGSAAYAIAELFDMPGGISYTFNQAKPFYGILSVIIFLGLAIHMSGINPIHALLLAAVINCICAAPLVACVILLANNDHIMGNYKNNKLSNIIGWTTFGIITAVATLTIYYQIV